ncbi:polynucleotide 5'-hydroxyl-kinase NOL9 [Paramormyrops kingsleyae]|uniref:polynucleotide 5'-hydroxyl-kinase NOL9 n=1 Tax=Paramormyrops kingsleyae TaxID=1676925 RepID=UPI003B9726A1
MKVPNSSMKVWRRHSGEARRTKKKKKHLSNHRATLPCMHPQSVSPDSTLAQKYHQLAAKGHTTLKRLKNSAKPVNSAHRHGSPPETNEKPRGGVASLCHTNGSMEADPQMDEYLEDEEDWRSLAQSLLHNGADGSAGSRSPPAAQPDGPEEDAVQLHAELDQGRSRAVLVLHQGQSLTFRGRSLLTCLYGRVEVLGFTIEEGQQPYPVFSPPTNCPLTITAVGNSTASKTKKERRLEAKGIIRKYLPSESRKRLQSQVDSESCVVLLEPLDTPLTRFLASLPEHRDLFGLSSKEIVEQCSILDSPLSGVGLIPLRGSEHGLMTSQSYRNAMKTLVNACAEEPDGCPVILICGAKNTGKSTFNRHLINTLLNHTASVDYLECDLGQTEFTPPGCLSLSSISEPLLGAPFTHQRLPQHMVYFGESSCERDLDRYLDSLKFLWRLYSQETPIIINTMGWVKGFGFQVLVDLIRLFNVSHVVQLSYGYTTQCPSLTPAFLQSAHGWQTRPPAQPALGHELGEQETPEGHVLLTVQSEFEGAGTTSNMMYHRSNIVRDLALLAYFSQLQSPDPEPIRPLHCFTPYQVSMSAVAMRVTHCEVAPAHVLYAANGSLVGLCCLEEKVGGAGGPVLLSQTPICKCIGFGVLRGVDMARGLYFLVTPVAPPVLRQVNCLLLGGIMLPHTLLRVQPGVQGEKPYITTDYSFELSGAGKMKVFKGLLRREYMGGGAH